MHFPRLVLASPSSGSGKTTVAQVLLAAYQAKNIAAQPFKIGPDYIDPTHLSQAAFKTARNLDGFFLNPPELLEIFRRGAKGAKLSLIEGMMGLFDGKDPLGKEGSTASVAKHLQAPVVLVVDASAMAGSVAALARGFSAHDPELKLRGVIANRVGSHRHAEIIKQALYSSGLPFFGYLPQTKDLQLPERHLGLVLAGEKSIARSKLLRYSKTLDLEGLLSLARQAPSLPSLPHQLPEAPSAARIGLAVAQDKAFCFYYPEALDLLEMLGADLTFFSPLQDAALPPRASAIWLGGGYPELFARELSNNLAMRKALAQFPGPILAECGGYMVLAERLVTSEGSFPMVGLIPGEAQMNPQPILGYRQVEALVDSPIARKGWVLKGHEFHYATLSPSSSPAWKDVETGKREGFGNEKIAASFLHIYFPACPEAARHFIGQAERVQKALLR